MAHQDFLSSMTFAASADCECDECGIPEEILEAVRKRKAEQTHAYGSNKRIRIEQRRELVARFGGYSIWKWVLPVGSGDPIVELRNSQRIVLVDRLSDQTQIKCIGRGIIGSAAEESERKIMNWEQGKGYYLPMHKGMSCGWICALSTDSAKDDGNAIQDEQQHITTSSHKDCDATLYILKVTQDALSEEVESAPSWVKTAKDHFISLNDSNFALSRDGAKDGMEGIHLKAESLTEIQQVLDEAMNAIDSAGPKVC